MTKDTSGGSTPDETARLRAAINQALHCTPQLKADGVGNYGIVYDCGDPWQILRTALQSQEPK